MDLGKMNPTAAGSAQGGMVGSGAMGRGPRDRVIGAVITVIKGNHKGYNGIIKDINGTTSPQAISGTEDFSQHLKISTSPCPHHHMKQTQQAMQESAFLDELYCHFPELLHKVMESSYFSDLVLKSISDARANEIKKLRGIAGDIFGLPMKYFTNTHYDRASAPEIQQLLGVTSASNMAYKTFPPVLCNRA
ncbi:hypothetical protein BDR03DRAFT_1018055 [Suillus americanus]|nr:hypothetical protein BDR03DRAFT_1018055 [Suillus americanus]